LKGVVHQLEQPCLYLGSMRALRNGNQSSCRRVRAGAVAVFACMLVTLELYATLNPPSEVVFTLGGRIHRTTTRIARRAVDDTFGWRGYDADALSPTVALRNGSPDFADIPVFNAHDIPRHVQDDPSWKGRPFILRGDSSVIDLQGQFSKDSLINLAKREKLRTRIGHSWSITKNGGQGPSEVEVCEYIEKMMHCTLYDGTTALEPAYAFDPSADLPGLPISVHHWIGSWDDAAFKFPESATRIMLLGGAGSGIGWHKHGASVQTTVHGRKRWFLYPPGTHPPGEGSDGGSSITDWLSIVYPTLRAENAPLEFIQHAGDTVHIPEGWYHAVINLADTVGASIQRRGWKNDFFSGICAADVEQLRATDPERWPV